MRMRNIVAMGCFALAVLFALTVQVMAGGDLPAGPTLIVL